MYFNSMFDLGLWDDTAQYAIFDDWQDWSKFYTYKQFLGAQKEFTVTDKYRKKRSVKWGRPSILLSNTDPAFGTNWDLPWLTLNAIKIDIGANKLY